MLLTTQCGMLVVMAATAIAIGSGSGSLWLLVISALCAGSANAIGQPVRSSLIPSLLKGDLLFSGIALNAIAITLSLVLGAVTAKIFGDWFGFDGAFWYLTALMAVGIVFLTRLRSPGPATRGDTATMRKAMGASLSFVWNDRGIRTLFALLCVSGLIMTPIMFVTTQAHIKEELGRSAGDAAPVIAMMGVGIAVTSVFIMRRGNMANKGVAFMRAMLLGTSSQILMGRTTEYWQVMLLALFMGMCGGFFINMNQGLIQANTPTELMGRVMGLYALVQNGLTPLGALVFGVLASMIGTGNAISLGSAVAFGVVLLIFLTSTEIRKIT
jgi:predicted MFS family arabinose efflux permease